MSNVVVVDLKNIPGPGEYEIVDGEFRLVPPVHTELEEARERLDKALGKVLDAPNVKLTREAWDYVNRCQEEVAELEEYQETLDEIHKEK